MLWLPVAYFVNQEIFTIATVSGRSMQPTLNPDDNRLGRDYVFVDRLSAWTRRLRRGDVVLMWSPDQVNAHMVKRLVAMPGDVVKPFNKPESDYITIPDGHCWVEGDEPFHSRDSNVFGPVPLSLVEGRVPHIIWPARWGSDALVEYQEGLCEKDCRCDDVDDNVHALHTSEHRGCTARSQLAAKPPAPCGDTPLIAKSGTQQQAVRLSKCPRISLLSWAIDQPMSRPGAVAAIVRITLHKSPAVISAYYDAILDFRDRILQEPGVLSYDICQAEKEANVFVIYEAFEHESIPNEVLPNRAYFHEHLKKVMPLWAKDREVTFCRLLHSNHLAPSGQQSPYPSPPVESAASSDSISFSTLKANLSP